MHQLKKVCTRQCDTFMTKELHKAFIKRSRLINKFLKDRTETNQKNFKLQKRFYKKLLSTTKISFYSNLNTKKAILGMVMQWLFL